MARNISQTAMQAMLARETGEQFLFTLKIDHADLDSPLKFVNDTQDLQRADGTYLAFPFEVNLPTDRQDDIPKVQLAIDNVDQRIIKAIRPLQTKPQITINIVLRSSPDTIEAGPFTMELKKVDYDAHRIRGDIGYEEDFLNEQIPVSSFTPQSTPGLF